MGATGSRKKNNNNNNNNNIYNSKNKLIIQTHHILNNKNYMEGKKHIEVVLGAELDEFPTKEMVESKTLESMLINSPRIKKFRPDRMKKLNLKKLIIKDRYRSDNTYENVIYLSNVSVLKTLIIENTGVVPILNNNNRMSLMKKLSGAENLTGLSLEGMHIDKFPKEFFELTKLKRLELCNNNIIEPSVLDDIYKFKNLESLDLSYNEKLKRLPNSISRLKKLDTLVLVGIKDLESLPKNIGNMNSLGEIAVSHRSKINIPESILKLSLKSGGIAKVQYIPETGNNYYLSVPNYYKKWKLQPPPKINKNTQFINK